MGAVPAWNENRGIPAVRSKLFVCGVCGVCVSIVPQDLVAYLRITISTDAMTRADAAYDLI